MVGAVGHISRVVALSTRLPDQEIKTLGRLMAGAPLPLICLRADAILRTDLQLRFVNTTVLRHIAVKLGRILFSEGLFSMCKHREPTI